MTLGAVKQKMTKPLVSAVLGCLTVAFCQAEDTTHWPTLSPPAGGFSIKMPGTPTLETRSVNDGGRYYTMYKYRLVRGNVTYQVVRADLAITIPQGEEDSLLRSAIEGMNKANRSHLVSNELLSFQGHAARMAVMKDAYGYQWNAFVCWDGVRAEIISYKAPAAQMGQPEVKAFFDTFTLVSD
jgi:hypothetical protein